MHISIFSIWMTVLWSSLLILVFYILRKRLILIDICSVSGVIILYLFCMIRMMLPLEFPWTIIVSGGGFYRAMYSALSYEIGKRLSVGYILAGIWIAGTMIFIIRHTVQYYALRRCFNRFADCTDEKTNDTMKRIDNSTKIKVLQTEAIDIPCCFGILHKRIALPAKEYTDDELYFILFHEYLHLNNRDILTKVLTNLFCAVYWWNPFVYLLKKDLNQSLEIRCDDIAVNGLDKKNRADYLSAMLTVFKNAGLQNTQEKNSYVTQMIEKHTERLIERFRIVAKGNKKRVRTGKLSALVIAGVMLMASYSVSIHPHYEAPMDEIETDENTHVIVPDDTYIIKKANGKYYLHTEFGDVLLGEEERMRLVDDGFAVYEE